MTCRCSPEQSCFHQGILMAYLPLYNSSYKRCATDLEIENRSVVAFLGCISTNPNANLKYFKLSWLKLARLLTEGISWSLKIMQKMEYMSGPNFYQFNFQYHTSFEMVLLSFCLHTFIHYLLQWTSKLLLIARVSNE